MKRLRRAFAFADLPVLGLVFLLVAIIGGSTVAMQWVHGSEILVPAGLFAALGIGLLAMIRPLPGWVVLLLALAGMVIVPYLYTSSLLTTAHPQDPYGIPSPETWAARLTTDQGIDSSLFLFLGSVLFWVVGAWLAWCSLRWRRVLLGLTPGIVIFATNVLNSKDEQNSYTIFFLIMSVALLLFNNYRASLTAAIRNGLKMSSDSRWDFWETGVAASAIVMMLAIFLPPLSRDDSTVNVETGVFRNWADFQQSLNHAVVVGKGGSASFSSGFSVDASLQGVLTRNDRLVMTYTVIGAYSGPRYFRGVDLLPSVRRSEWGYVPNPLGFQAFLPKNSDVPYTDDKLVEQYSSSLRVHMIRPPQGAPDVMFYPGELTRVDRDTTAIETFKTTAAPTFAMIDRVNSAHPASSGGFYTAQVSYPNPTEDELRTAGTAYPDFIAPYRSFGITNPRQFLLTPPSIAPTPAAGATPAPAPSASFGPGVPAAPPDPLFTKIAALANSITKDATNPYDKAVAIETYLRANYAYSLEPGAPAGGQDPLESFLFTNKVGYCEFFASAMGHMLRAEGIPTRLVNGYGQGTFDTKNKQWVVKETDAHTWVEAYFPTYGWIPFEPTPDGQYFPVQRAITVGSNCTRDVCQTTGEGETSGVTTTGKPKGIQDVPEQGAVAAPTAPNYFPPIAGGILVALAGLFLLLSRYLRPRSVAQVWRRLALLCRLAGLPAAGGDTPAEFGRRLAIAIPEAAVPIRAIADNFAVAAYAPRHVAETRKAAIMELWQQLRPALLRRVARRLTPAW